MSATTLPISTHERTGAIFSYPVAAATKIPAGVLVALNAAGAAVNASDAAALRVVGRAEETIDNTAGAAGDLEILVKSGIFKYANSASAAVDADDIGKFCFVEDNQTVAETSTHKLKAGRVREVESDGVWVDTGYAHDVIGVLTLTSTDGTAAAASASLANLAAETEKVGDDLRALVVLLQTQGVLK